jgi:hypothetical protein
MLLLCNNITAQSGKNCEELVLFVSRLSKLHNDYQRSINLKLDNKASYRSRYVDSVNLFKSPAKKYLYSQCLQQLIKEDSLNSISSIVQFTYQPPEESTIRDGAFLNHGDYLRLLLWNLQFRSTEFLLLTPTLSKKPRY